VALSAYPQCTSLPNFIKIDQSAAELLMIQLIVRFPGLYSRPNTFSELGEPNYIKFGKTVF